MVAQASVRDDQWNVEHTVAIGQNFVAPVSGNPCSWVGAGVGAGVWNTSGAASETSWTLPVTWIRGVRGVLGVTGGVLDEEECMSEDMEVTGRR